LPQHVARRKWSEHSVLKTRTYAPQHLRSRLRQSRKKPLVSVVCVTIATILAGFGANSSLASSVAKSPSSVAPGYWLASSAGVVAVYGGTAPYKKLGHANLRTTVVGIASTADGRGYWLATSSGGVFSFGDAKFFGSMGRTRLNKKIVGIAATPDGRGYWLVGADGGVFAFGDATFDGPAPHLTSPVVGMEGSPSGKGYWLVARDGGVFAFGDAHFYGSAHSRHLLGGVVGMAATPSGDGYWLTTAHGKVVAFGGADNYGSLRLNHLKAPIVGMAPAPNGRGYWLVARDGGVFAFGGAKFMGSDSGHLRGGQWVSAIALRLLYPLGSSGGSGPTTTSGAGAPTTVTGPTPPVAGPRQLAVPTPVAGPTSTTAPAATPTTAEPTSTTAAPHQNGGQPTTTAPPVTTTAARATTTTAPVTPSTAARVTTTTAPVTTTAAPVTTTTAPVTTTATAAPPPTSTGAQVPPASLFPSSLFSSNSGSWPVDPSSSELVSDLVNDYQTDYGAVGVNSMPIYSVPADQPDATVSLQTGCQPEFLADTGSEIPIPPNAVLSTSSDGPLVIYQPSTMTEWELWQVTRQSATAYTACWGGELDIATSNGFFSSNYGLSASGISYLATTITEADVESGSINHAIALTIPNCNSFVYPAPRGDCPSIPGQPGEGQWFRFPANLAMPSGLTPFGQMVFRALQTYGMVVVDQGGAVMLEAEQQADWAAEGNSGTDPITASWDGEQEYQVIANLPWADLQVVDPPQ
jgi:hypothetical protein